MKTFFLSGILLLFLLPGECQNAKLQGWHIKDQQASGYYGISLDKAYQFLAGKNLKSTPVIVAILDDGIDTSHEDLQKVLWTNPREIPANGVDDDANGYIDDVHGWNFLGSRDGRNVLANSSEWIRVYWRYKAKYEGVNIDTSQLEKAQKYEYAMWQKARSGVVGKGMKEDELGNLKTYLANALFCDSVLKPKLGKMEFTAKQLMSYNPSNKLEKQVKEFFVELFKQFTTPDVTDSFVMDEFEKYVTGEIRRANGDKVPPEDDRRKITGDDEKTEANRLYGNSNITNGELMHGSHVAGIVGADRNNGKGMQGIADNVQIMMVRTSADGDEFDKDIATGIRYAVDNGAKVINMSFGKSLSPDKKMVDDAVKYALSKDVLLVQAAGNSKRNIDALDNYPNPKYLQTDSVAPNWITVGASDTIGKAADFSNYGPHIANVFAPGIAIYSSVPGGDKYMSWDGTSMASPVVTGVAALLRSYFPQLHAAEIKKIIEESVSIPTVETFKPGTTEKVNMNKLCTSGGIVNSYNAAKLAFGYHKP
ncbi:MAG: peptidase and in kexin sedolisin [Ferruginibacter sp.]|nr:peptidase and in kexin sedolisin [Ferruginibacter sp.]